MKKLAIVAALLPFLFPTFASAATCPNISIRLSNGSSYSQVIALKKFLVAEGVMGPNSYTTYFGPLTQAALQKWQCKQGIVCSGTPASTGYGATGPKTRAALKNCSVFSGNNPGGVTKPIGIPPTQAPPSGGGSGGGSGVSPNPVSYSWQTGAWSSCVNNTQTRTVTCISSQNQNVADSLCTSPKPVASQSCSNTSPPPLSCSFNGQTIAHGASVAAYQSASVPAGQSCASETRICTNGALSGSYASAACSVDTGLSFTPTIETVVDAHVSNGKHYFTLTGNFGDAKLAAAGSCTPISGGTGRTVTPEIAYAVYNQLNITIPDVLIREKCTFSVTSTTYGTRSNAASVTMTEFPYIESIKDVGVTAGKHYFTLTGAFDDGKVSASGSCSGQSVNPEITYGAYNQVNMAIPALANQESCTFTLTSTKRGTQSNAVAITKGLADMQHNFPQVPDGQSLIVQFNTGRINRYRPENKQQGEYVLDDMWPVWSIGGQIKTFSTWHYRVSNIGVREYGDTYYHYNADYSNYTSDTSSFAPGYEITWGGQMHIGEGEEKKVVYRDDATQTPFAYQVIRVADVIKEFPLNGTTYPNVTKLEIKQQICAEGTKGTPGTKDSPGFVDCPSYELHEGTWYFTPYIGYIQLDNVISHVTPSGSTKDAPTTDKITKWCWASPDATSCP